MALYIQQSGSSISGNECLNQRESRGRTGGGVHVIGRRAASAESNSARTETKTGEAPKSRLVERVYKKVVVMSVKWRQKLHNAESSSIDNMKECKGRGRSNANVNVNNGDDVIASSVFGLLFHRDLDVSILLLCPIGRSAYSSRIRELSLLADAPCLREGAPAERSVALLSPTVVVRDDVLGSKPKIPTIAMGTPVHLLRNRAASNLAVHHHSVFCTISDSAESESGSRESPRGSSREEVKLVPEARHSLEEIRLTALHRQKGSESKNCPTPYEKAYFQEHGHYKPVGVAIIGKGIVALPVTEHKFGIPAEPARMYPDEEYEECLGFRRGISGPTAGNLLLVDAMYFDIKTWLRDKVPTVRLKKGGSDGHRRMQYCSGVAVPERCQESALVPNLDNTLTSVTNSRPQWSPRCSNKDAPQTVSNSSAGSTAPRRSGIRMFGQNLSMDSTQIAGSQGSRSQPLSVEVTVLRARNVPQFKTTFGGKREYFVTITYGATTKKTKKQTKRRTKSAQIDGQIVAWDQRLDALYDILIFDHMFRLKVPISLVQPSSHISLRLYAKKSITSDILIGTHEMTLPVVSQINTSVTLGDGNEQAGRSTPPVTLDLTITVLADGTSPSDPHIIPTEGDDAPAEDFPQPTMAPDSSGPDRPSAPGHLSHPPDHRPVESSTLMPQDQGETSVVEKHQIVSVDQVEEVIDRSNTWEGAVGRIKWVMDTLSPVAELHPIAQMAYKVLSVIPEELSKQYQRDKNVRALVKSMHDAFDFANAEDTLKTIKPQSNEAKILTQMLRDVSSCSDFIQSYINDSQFSKRMAKSIGGGVEEKIQELSVAFVENRKAFLDGAVVST
ncbi:hypothetical protein EDB84DRAFT_1673774, partial [Lactarius hengduanensis]